MTPLTFAARGDVSALNSDAQSAMFARTSSNTTNVEAQTAAIVQRVRATGDEALLEMAQTFDGVRLEAIEVPRARWDAALSSLPAELRRAIERAAANIRAVHEAFRPVASEVTTADGAVIGRRPDALTRVGVYAPGGRATYPSSLLMGAVPARVAGVREIIVCSPPDASGEPSAVLLAAAAIAGVDRVFAVGGAGAIAAMAYGTATIPAVDRIVGPGNAFVAEAKRQVSRTVGIDSPAGPSELLVIADASASADVIASEMLAQAEHDPDAAVVLVSTESALVDAVERVLNTRIITEPRAVVIRAAFAARGGLLTVPSLVDAVEFANRWSAEHVLLALEPSTQDRVLAELRGAGTVFVGETASVAFGDYLSGANHVLPTGGLARIWSGLSTLDFVRWTTWQRINRNAARAMARDVSIFAEAEGLPAHAAAARQWEGA